MSAQSTSMLDHFARLAASVSECAVAAVGMRRRRLGTGHTEMSFGLSQRLAQPEVLFRGLVGRADGLTVVPDLRDNPQYAASPLVTGPLQMRFLAYLPILSPGGEPIGFIAMLDRTPRDGLTPAQIEGIGTIAEAILSDRRREQRHTHMMHVVDRALRADRMLRLVSEAVSCAAALTNLLEELCRFHGAAIGRIWQLEQPGGILTEISRYNAGLAHTAFFDSAPPGPLTVAGSITARAIQANTPHAVMYSDIERPERVVLLDAARASGLTCQVSVPIWVQQQRFGISLAFTDKRDDLSTVMADIASLANTIRPALFRKVTEEHIRYVAHHDDLTQLANRIEFQERLNDAVARAGEGEHGLALIYLDLDGFKLVNDTQGHEAGDKLLTAFANRLRENTRDGDTVARMGGDEFAIVQPLGGQPTAATALAQRLLETVRQPFFIDGQQAQIGVSIGIAIYPVDGDTPDLLLRNADTAMYRAKEAGRNTFQVFEHAMGMRRKQRLVVEQDLSVAIEREQFTLNFQPICDAATLNLRGFEALLRWNHPVRGQVQPDEFVGLAERTGLIVPLGRWALERACSEAASWSAPSFLSVNLSPKQFRQPDLPAQVADVLARTGLPPDRLDLEVTEGLLLDNSGVVLRNMRLLKENGIRITLDDFGTAYASLAYLRRFPFDQIKIDRSFVQGMCGDGPTLAIVRAILSLGAQLNLAVIAEGVETAEELEMLRSLGCTLVQGFLPGRPMPADEARRFPVSIGGLA